MAQGPKRLDLLDDRAKSCRRLRRLFRPTYAPRHAGAGGVTGAGWRFTLAWVEVDGQNTAMPDLVPHEVDRHLIILAAKSLVS
jgi:hypothetical protein